MEWIIVRDYEAMSEVAAKRIQERLSERPELVLGLATGSTPIGVYARLVEAYRAGKISFARARAVNLDEYVGLSSDHPQSYAYFMREHLFGHIDMPPSAHDIPNGMAPDLEAECARYEAHIRALGGVDLQLVGIGTNGHIGFNEPGTPFTARTHVVELTASTREANARFFNSMEEVPTHAVTMGLGTIMEAREIILLASGASKREAIRRLYDEAPNVDLPASVLKEHPRVVVIVDEAAAEGITK
ncbi:MAG: glucosamine-6-phosphate deaminase [Hydrogenibacillus sp.]|nr:glucosamine-6-phosphate deaminase [Hydrogenibacillus sp.]